MRHCVAIHARSYCLSALICSTTMDCGEGHGRALASPSHVYHKFPSNSFVCEELGGIFVIFFRCMIHDAFDAIRVPKPYTMTRYFCIV